jgi:hypothetical protein
MQMVQHPTTIAATMLGKRPKLMAIYEYFMHSNYFMQPATTYIAVHFYIQLLEI